MARRRESLTRITGIVLQTLDGWPMPSRGSAAGGPVTPTGRLLAPPQSGVNHGRCAPDSTIDRNGARGAVQLTGTVLHTWPAANRQVVQTEI